jgi:hypothetical protein
MMVAVVEVKGLLVFFVEEQAEEVQLLDKE